MRSTQKCGCWRLTLPAALSQREPSAQPIPAPASDLPGELKTDIENFVEQVPK